MYRFPAFVSGRGPIRSIPTFTLNDSIVNNGWLIERNCMYTHIYIYTVYKIIHVPTLQASRVLDEVVLTVSQTLHHSLSDNHTSTHKFCYIMKYSFPIKPPTDFQNGFIMTQMTSYETRNSIIILEQACLITIHDANSKSIEES